MNTKSTQRQSPQEPSRVSGTDDSGNTKMKTEKLEKNNVTGFTTFTEGKVYAQNGYEMNLSLRKIEFNGSPKIANA